MVKGKENKAHTLIKRVCNTLTDKMMSNL